MKRWLLKLISFFSSGKKSTEPERDFEAEYQAALRSYTLRNHERRVVKMNLPLSASRD